jgi:hypothetical protein
MNVSHLTHPILAAFDRFCVSLSHIRDA